MCVCACACACVCMYVCVHVRMCVCRVYFRILAKGGKMRYNGILGGGAMWYDPPGSKLGDPGNTP